MIVGATVELLAVLSKVVVVEEFGYVGGDDG